MHKPIAILDSGVGGLTVAKEVMRQLPHENIVYFGDTGRAPYGPRPPQEVLRFTRQIVDYLLQFHPKMIVIACNTATAVAIDEIRESVPVPVVGVIDPGARAAIKMTRTNGVGVIGTEGTIMSGAYEKALRSISPGVRIASLACPDFVPLVEQGLFDAEETDRIVERSLAPIRQEPMDCLILGCTHYPFLAPAIARVMGRGVKLISSADETALDVSAILNEQGMRADPSEMPVHRFFCSGDPQIFRRIAQLWLGEQIKASPVVWQVPHII